MPNIKSVNINFNVFGLVRGIESMSMDCRTNALITTFYFSLEVTVDTFVRRTIQQLGLKAIGSSLFGVKAYNVREHALLYFTYHCNIKDLPPSELLFFE